MIDKGSCTNLREAFSGHDRINTWLSVPDNFVFSSFMFCSFFSGAFLALISFGNLITGSHLTSKELKLKVRGHIWCVSHEVTAWAEDQSKR